MDSKLDTGFRFDVEQLRQEFPILERQIDGNDLVYFDSAATSLKPRCVIDAVTQFFTHYTANVSRGVHRLGDEVNDRFVEARDTIAGFINAEPGNLVLTQNSTHAINLVASNHRNSKVFFCLGDHHSNLLPWAQCKGSTSIGIKTDGRVDFEELVSRLNTDRPDILAVSHVTNAFGAVNPIQEIIQAAQPNRMSSTCRRKSIHTSLSDRCC